jgi:hypothetical protein
MPLGQQGAVAALPSSVQRPAACWHLLGLLALGELFRGVMLRVECAGTEEWDDFTACSDAAQPCSGVVHRGQPGVAVKLAHVASSGISACAVFGFGCMSGVQVVGFRCHVAVAALVKNHP